MLGVSSHGLQWFPNCATKEGLEFIVSNWGVNVFRSAMYVMEHGYHEHPDTIKALVKNLIKWTADLGIYVIVDW